MTDKGKQYVAWEKQDVVGVRLSILEFVEITRIHTIPEFNVATVEYTTKLVKITPFGKALGATGDYIENSVEVQKYDDGWRID